MKVRTTDDSLSIYEGRHLSSKVVAIPKDTTIDLGASEEADGREWIEVAVDGGSKGYVLGPAARGHTTLAGAGQVPRSASAVLSKGDTICPPKKDARGWVFRDEDSARSTISRWQSLLPKQKSSYGPSGKVTSIGVLKLLTRGMVAGSIFTFLYALVCTLALGYLFAFMLRLGAFASLIYVVAVFAVGFVFVGPGLLAAMGVGGVSRWAKNRNALAAGLVAAASSIVGWFVFCRWSLPSISRTLLDARPPMPQGATGETYSNFIFLDGFLRMLPVAVIVFVFFAYRHAAQMVRDAKFCEECGEYMGARRLGSLSLKQALDLIAAAKEGRLAQFSLYNETDFTPAELTAFKCDTCSAGYLEISVNFRAAYRNERSWRVGISAKKWLGFSAATACDLSRLYNREGHPDQSPSSEGAAT